MSFTLLCSELQHRGDNCKEEHSPEARASRLGFVHQSEKTNPSHKQSSNIYSASIKDQSGYLIFVKIRQKTLCPNRARLTGRSLTWIWWEKCSALKFFGTWYCKLFHFCVFLSLQAHSTPPPPPKPQNSWPRHHVGCCSNRFRCSKCTNCQLKVAHSKAKHANMAKQIA